jgi:hypothetical protein
MAEIKKTFMRIFFLEDFQKITFRTLELLKNLKFGRSMRSITLNQKYLDFDLENSI